MVLEELQEMVSTYMVLALEDPLVWPFHWRDKPQSIVIHLVLPLRYDRWHLLWVHGARGLLAKLFILVLSVVINWNHGSLMMFFFCVDVSNYRCSR